MFCVFSSKWLDRLSEVTGMWEEVFWVNFHHREEVVGFPISSSEKSWKLRHTEKCGVGKRRNEEWFECLNSHTAQNDLRKSHFAGYVLAFGKKRENFTSCFQLRLFPTTFTVHVPAPATHPISDSNRPLSGRLTTEHFAPYSIPSNWMNISTLPLSPFFLPSLME